MDRTERSEKACAGRRPATMRGVSFSYCGAPQQAEVPVVAGVSADLPGGMVTAFVGPSGCGKTTILKLLAGLLIPSHGTIANVAQRPGRRPRCGFVFQEPSLLPWQPVLGNALLGVSVQGRIADADRERANLLLTTFGLDAVLDRYPSSLSGGMQQRAALARALLARPDVLLLDEPFAHSDLALRRQLYADVSKAVDDEQLPAILVTHDATEACKIADQIYVLSQRPARVVDLLKIAIPRAVRLAHRSFRMEAMGEALDVLTNWLENPAGPQ